jgi:hypothetical protein
MAEPMYFQWQNPVLLKTIYPRRNRKLADFLIYCREIDLWEEYKNKDIADLGEEVKAYIAERDQAVMTAYKAYRTEYDYFTVGDIRTPYVGKYKLKEETELTPIQELHRAFKDNLPKRQDVRKEKNFVAYYVTLWQEKVRRLEEEVTRRERRLAVMHPDHYDRPVLTQELQKLKEVTLPLLKEERERLLKFLSTYNKIEKRKLEFYKKTEAAKTGIQSTRAKLDAVNAPLKRLETEGREFTVALARLRTPPQRKAVEGYFSSDDVFDELCRQFPQADPAVIHVVNGIHKRLVADLRALKSPEVQRSKLGDYVHELQRKHGEFLKEVNGLEMQLRSMAGDSGQRGTKQARLNMLRDSGLKAVEAELDKVSDYHAAFEYEQKPQAEWMQMTQEKERLLQENEKKTQKLKEQATPLEEELKAKESILSMSEVDYLVRFTPEQQPITVRDIVRGKVESYKASLDKKMDRERPEEEVQQELLAEIVQRFREKPKEYPLWLQYMVIHFSGMRYATAHGSWADPKDLLVSLRTAALEKDFRRMDDDDVEAMCEQRISAYETRDPGTAPKLALATDQKSQERILTHLKGLKSAYRRREALLDLLLDEEKYEIEDMSPAKALEALESMRDEKTLPDWMWKEIVRLTELRVQEAKDPDWNKLTQEEQDQKNEARYAEFRAIMNKWKQDHLTGWREEHDRSNRLIVTSSVCNEVAEQILHLRGHSPSGGLTGIVDWYMKTVNEDKVPGTPRPYFAFVKDGAQDYYREGANILWLRFVYERPNPWRVAKPLAVNGDRLIPDKYRRNEGKEGEWTYFESDVITRKRTRTVEKRLVKDEQWLRWIHVATVAKVGETADGPVVLTFETALPYDDPSVSAVGIFKHDLQNLMWDGGEDYYNGSFIAYLPDEQVPDSDLKEMLDWNKILRK